MLEKLKKAANAYYNGQPIMSDEEYDRLYEAARQRYPDDPFFRSVGAPPQSLFAKIEHEIPMGSLNKVKDEEELRRWWAKIPQSEERKKVLIHWKFDGCSVDLRYVRGKLVQAVSRGDGRIGEDITANVLKSKHIPKQLTRPFTGHVRGEAILYKKDFETYFAGMSNPRNAGNGVLRNKHGEGCEHLRVLAFDTLLDGTLVKNEHTKQKLLIALGFEADQGEIATSVDEILLVHQARAKLRDDLPYEVDGLVLRVNDVEAQESMGERDGRPKGQMAFKFEAHGAVTTLQAIELTVGHTGAIIPTGKVEPVEIGGVTVTSVLLNNFDQIKEQRLKPGRKILLERAGDVIPRCLGLAEEHYRCTVCGKEGVLSAFVEHEHRDQLQRVTDSFPEPTACPVCGRDGAAVICTNPDCEGKEIRKLRRWIKSLDIKHIGPAVERAIYDDLQVRSPVDLYRKLLITDFSDLQVGAGRLGTARMELIQKEIEAKRRLTVPEFLGSLGIRFLGKRSVVLLGQKAGLTTLRDWLNLTEEQALQMGEEMGPSIRKDLQALQPEIDELLSFVKIKEEQAQVQEDNPPSTDSGTLAGRSFCFTGKIERCDAQGNRFTRRMMQDLVREHGGVVYDKVKAGLDYLVQADPNSQSSKTKKAKQQGTTILAEEDFFKMLA